MVISWRFHGDSSRIEWWFNGISWMTFSHVIRLPISNGFLTLRGERDTQPQIATWKSGTWWQSIGIGMTIDSDYGSFSHSLVRIQPLNSDYGWLWDYIVIMDHSQAPVSFESGGPWGDFVSLWKKSGVLLVPILHTNHHVWCPCQDDHPNEDATILKKKNSSRNQIVGGGKTVLREYYTLISLISQPFSINCKCNRLSTHAYYEAFICQK